MRVFEAGFWPQQFWLLTKLKAAQISEPFCMFPSPEHFFSLTRCVLNRINLIKKIILSSSSCLCEGIQRQEKGEPGASGRGHGGQRGDGCPPPSTHSPKNRYLLFWCLSRGNTSKCINPGKHYKI